MNKKTLSLTLSSAIASTLLSAAPVIHAGENPFAMSRIDASQQVAAADEKAAEASCSDKMKEGKTAEGKCGADKMKAKEGSCSAKKGKEGSCSASKAKEASCSANKKAADGTEKMPEGKCSAEKK